MLGRVCTWALEAVTYHQVWGARDNLALGSSELGSVGLPWWFSW